MIPNLEKRYLFYTVNDVVNLWFIFRCALRGGPVTPISSQSTQVVPSTNLPEVPEGLRPAWSRTLRQAPATASSRSKIGREVRIFHGPDPDPARASAWASRTSRDLLPTPLGY